jgi:hypothetical protein
MAAAAAGTLQNMSRETASRLLIRKLDAVPELSVLLSAPDLQAQVSNSEMRVLVELKDLCASVCHVSSTPTFPSHASF